MLRVVGVNQTVPEYQHVSFKNDISKRTLWCIEYVIAAKLYISRIDKVQRRVDSGIRII